jgi:hypothetical protein
MLLERNRVGQRFFAALSGLRYRHHGQRRRGGDDHSDRRVVPTGFLVRKFCLRGGVALHVQHFDSPVGVIVVQSHFRAAVLIFDGF